MPEVVVGEALVAFNLTRLRISDEHTRGWMTTWHTKLAIARPPPQAVVWHCHNQSARAAWLDAEEHHQRSRGSAVTTSYEEALRASAGVRQRSTQYCYNAPLKSLREQLLDLPY